MVTLLYENRIICQLTCIFNFFGNHIKISGTDGIIEVNNLTSLDSKTIYIKNSDNIVQSEIEISEFDHFNAQINHFNEYISENKKILISKEETIATISQVDQLRMKEEIILLN